MSNHHPDRPQPATRNIGYCRLPTGDEPFRRDVLTALTAAGAERVFTDRALLSRRGRPEWEACQASLMAGDRLIVPALDHLADSVSAAVHMLCDLLDQHIGVVSLGEPDIDTTRPDTPAVQILTVLAEVEHRMRRQRVRLSLAELHAAGRKSGRPTVITPERLQRAASLRAAGATFSVIARDLGVGQSSVRRALHKSGDAYPQLSGAEKDPP